MNTPVGIALDAVETNAAAICCIWVALAIACVINNLYNWNFHGRKTSPDVPPWISIAYLCYDGIISTPLSLMVMVATMTWLGVLACCGEGFFVALMWLLSLAIFRIGLVCGHEWKVYRPIIIAGLREKPGHVAWYIMSSVILLPGTIASEYTHEFGNLLFQTFLGLRVVWFGMHHDTSETRE